MNRNIAKPFAATLSLLDVASDKTHKYKCFHGEDVQLTVNVVGEEGRRIDLSNMSVKIYFTLDKNVNEPVYRQDTGIVVNNFGVITVMLEKSYIRIGNNTLKIVLYDEDQTVFLQPLIINCIDPLIGEVADLEIPDDIDVRDELYDIRRIIGDLQDFDDDLGREIIEARNEYETVGERLDDFDSQLAHNISVIDDNSTKDDSTWSSYKINNTITRLQTGFKIPIVTEQPDNPVDGEMWILKTIINDGSDEPVLLHNEFNKSGDVNLGAISNLGHKTAIGITPTYSFTLTNLKIKATTRSSNIHNSKMSIKIELCRVSNGQPSTVLETQYAESPSTSETLFAIEATFNSKLMQGIEYCIVLSTTTTSTCYVSIRGTVINSFDFIYGLNYANSNETWAWGKHLEQDANFNMYGIRL